MNCPKCNTNNLDNLDFCLNCGTNLKVFEQQNVNTNNIQITTSQPTNMQDNKKKSLLPIIIILILIVIAIFSITKGLLGNSKSSQNKVDSNINLTYDEDGAFLMTVDDTFTITGRGITVTGKILRGTIKENDKVQIIGLNHKIMTTTVTDISIFRESRDYAKIGENVGILLKDVSKEDIETGQVLAKPNSIKAIKKFVAKVKFLSKEEGGRQTPIFNNYSPQFYFRNIDIKGNITLPKKVEMVNPGESANLTVELDKNIAMEVGTEFFIREGGKTIGEGIVTKIYQ